MDKWIQEKYIHLIANRLERFKKLNSGLFNFRCFYCGDSAKNATKTRGYIYCKKQDYFYYCHNCHKSKSFVNFLKEIEYGLYGEMLKDSYTTSPLENEEPKEIITEQNYDLNLPTIESLGKNHTAYKYLSSRKLPKKKYSELYFTEDFASLVNSFIPGKFKSKKHEVPRIIIPFFDRNNKLFGFQGRALDPNDDIRYISIILDDSKPKAYNANNVDFNKRYYMTEGPFDSMFLDNSLAACGSDIISVIYNLNCNKDNLVVVFDNEPRNADITKNIERCIKSGYKVCVWPNWWEYKDINDAVIGGYTPSEVNAIIDSNTFENTEAELKLTLWRKK